MAQDSLSNTEIPVSDIQKKVPDISKVRVSRALTVIVLIILIILGSYLVLNLLSSKKAKIAALSKQAQTESASGDFTKAKKDLDQALALDKKDSGLLTQQINTIAAEGNETGKEKEALDSAKPYIDMALALNNNDIDALLAIGYAYETAGDYQKAFEYYSKATQINPKSAMAWFHLGHVLEFLGQRKEAYADYDKAFALDPNNAQILIVKANMLLTQNKTQEAFEALLKASKQQGIDNQTKSEALAAASTLRTTQDFFRHMTEALSLGKQAVDTDPTSSQALAAYGWELFLVKKRDEGISYLKKAIEVNPRITKNYYILAQALRLNKQYPDAINYLNQALAKVEDDNTITTAEDRVGTRGIYSYELAKTYSMSGVSGDTMSLLNNAVKDRPTLKNQIKSDYQLIGIFKELKDNPDFLKLVNGA